MKHEFSSVLTVGALLSSVATYAQSLEPEAPADRTGFSASLDVTTAYYFRGVLQERNGLILQPAAEVAWDLSNEADGSWTFALGNWHSFHDRGTAAANPDSFVETWYEADWYASLGMDHGDWTFGLTWTNYSSPSGAFATIDELAVSASYDDSASGSFGMVLNPTATVAFEIDDHGGDENIYVQLGISPDVSIDLGSRVVDLSMPITLGLSGDDYYVDGTGSESTFGYLDVGLETSLPMGIGASYGDWSWSAGLHFLLLGDATEEINNGDGSAVIATLGLSVGI